MVEGGSSPGATTASWIVVIEPSTSGKRPSVLGLRSAAGARRHGG